jgi:hypothetical protein
LEERPRGYYKVQDFSDEIRRLISEQEKAEALKLLRSFEKKRREAEQKAAEAFAKERAALRKEGLDSLFEAENLRGNEAMKGLGSGQLELIRAILEGRRARERERGESLIRELKNSAVRNDAELGRDYSDQREILGESFRAKLMERLLNEAKRVDASFKELKPSKAAGRSSGGAYSQSGTSSVKTGAALTSLLREKSAKKKGSPKGGGMKPQLSYHVK